MRFEAVVDPLIEKISQQCPPPKEMKSLLNQKNKISSGLNIIQSTLSTLTKTTTTLEKAVSSIEKAKLAVEVAMMALPSAIAGVGIPVGVITTVSTGLDLLGEMIKKNKGLSQQGLVGIGSMNHNLSIVQTKLNSIDILINYCTQDLNKEQLDELGIELNETVDTNIDPEKNKDEGKKLLDQLKPGSLDPLFYRGFKLTLSSNLENTFSFPQRRVTAKNPSTNITLEGPWSFSSSTQILIEEIKFKIDQYLLSLEPDPTPAVVLVDEIEIPEPPSIDKPPVGVYWKYSNHSSVYYELEGESQGFEGATEYKIHRAMHGFPTDFSQIENRGPKPGYTPPPSSSPPPPQVKTYYTTKRSDKISEIASKYGTTVVQIKKWNPNLKYKNERKEGKGKLVKGQSILVSIKSK